MISGRHNLRYWAALYDVPAPVARERVEELLTRIGLTDRADDKVLGYSRGMRQRLHLARGLVSGARVLFLDEPTTGLDPVAARDFRDLIRTLKGEGCTILLTTHDMAEAESVCDRVALIDRGRLLATETPRSLGRLIAEHERIDCEGANTETLEYVRAMLGVAAVVPKAEGGWRILMSDSEAIPRVIKVLAEAGVASINTSRPSLEEVYLHIMGDRGLKV
jgi:ABC-2 type transport system ATP-binding protein